MASGGGNLGDACKSYQTKPGGLTTKDLTMWCKDAKIYNKKITTTNTDILHSKHMDKKTKLLDMSGLEKLINDIETEMKCDKDSVKGTLADTTKQVKTGPTSKTGGVDRLTDTSKYTGAHKERFDESGKGKGAEGRSDKADNSGYVGNYKGADTFDKKE